MSDKSAGIFSLHAKELCQHGLAVIPCPGGDGKSPQGAVKNFQHWSSPPSARFLNRMIQRHPDANIGIVTSASDLTIIDVDGGEDLASEMERLCGTTPLAVATPSGGTHFYYRSSGERSANLRSRGFNADIKGTGAGVVIVPPSVNRSSGVPYRLVRGDWSDLARLPKMNPVRWPQRQSPEQPIGAGAIEVGQRNNDLFREAISIAAGHCNLDDLQRSLLRSNASLNCPLDDREVGKIASSAWRYRQEGKLRSKPRNSLDDRLLEVLAGEKRATDALWLYLVFERAHGGDKARRHNFAASPDAMAMRGQTACLSAHRIRAALRVLVETGLLIRTHNGGRGQHDPARYSFPIAYRPSSAATVAQPSAAGTRIEMEEV